MTVQLIANAGLFILLDGIHILIDALHCRKTERFSRVPEQTLRDIILGNGPFSRIDLMLVTHTHPDHYDASSVSAFLQNHPETTLLAPIEPGSSQLAQLRAESHIFDFCNISIACRRVTHDGSQYANVPNYGFLLTGGSRSFLTLGDAAPREDEIASLVGEAHVDVAALCFPFVTLARGKRIVREVIRPAHTVACHLPFPQDDHQGYIETTLRLTQKDRDTMPPCTVLFQENQSVDI